MKDIAQPARVALTGRTASPGLFDVIAVLGRTPSPRPPPRGGRRRRLTRYEDRED